MSDIFKWPCLLGMVALIAVAVSEGLKEKTQTIISLPDSLSERPKDLPASTKYIGMLLQGQGGHWECNFVKEQK